jgi:hypothetical protein
MGAGCDTVRRRFAALIALSCAPAFAQVDLSGEWASRYT